MPDHSFRSTCCIVGGGPAGIMLGYLLARDGVQVTVLEKHKDFFRDFRGDTVHASTLEVIYELGLLPEFLTIPHQRISSAGAVYGGFVFKAADFSRLPTRCKFIALMPQWDFLNFFSSKAREFPSFDLRMEHEAVALIRDGARVTGVEVRTPEGDRRIAADLVVACDGRHSTIRKSAGVEIEQLGVPIDVLWFRLSRRAGDPENVFGNINYGSALILIDRGDYFQAGWIIPKGSLDEIKRAGLDSVHARLIKLAPYLGERVYELKDWEQMKLLTVQINRAVKWTQPGLLLIGDAAHAMSPAGGVGINLAVQDAVAAANMLAQPLRGGQATEAVLAGVQRRREFPTRVTQRAQANAHAVFKNVFRNAGPLEAPWQLKAAVRIPGLQHVVGRLVGLGVRPEHVNGAKRGTSIWKISTAVAGVAAMAWFLNARRRKVSSRLPAPRTA